MHAWRSWNVEAANASLPALRELLRSVRASMARAQQGKARADPRLIVRGAVTALATEGILLRDPRRGLVDFPARAANGRDYWLCWVVDEPAVAWWHWVEDGFAGRAPISELPE